MDFQEDLQQQCAQARQSACSALRELEAVDGNVKQLEINIQELDNNYTQYTALASYTIFLTFTLQRARTDDFDANAIWSRGIAAG